MNEWNSPRVPLPREEEQEASVSPLQRSLQLSAVCLGIAVIPIFTALVQVLLLSAVQVCAPSLLDLSWFLTACSAGSNYLVAFPLSLLIFRMARTYRQPHPARVNLAELAALTVLGFACAALGGTLGEWVNGLLSRISGVPAENPVGAMTDSTPFWANLLFLGILAPIAEEICYRKLVIDRLRPFGDRFAILFSGLVFGAAHGNFSQFFYAAAFGVLAGAVYLYTGKLRYTVAMHMALNLVGGVFSAELVKAINALGVSPQSSLSQLLAANTGVGVAYAVYQGFMYLCILLSPVAAVFLYRRASRVRANACNGTKGTLKQLLRAPAFWVLAAVLLILFIF